MPIFEHQVPPSIRTASHWDADYGAYQAPEGRYWVYTDDPRQEHVSWQDGTGRTIAVAVWLQ